MKGGEIVRRLIPIEELWDQAEESGIDPNHLMVDPDDVCEINPEDLEPEKIEED
jgi:hypothetical protein